MSALDKLHFIGNNLWLIEIFKTNLFETWFANLREVKTFRRNQARIYRLYLGSYRNIESVSMGMSEMRFYYGSGCRAC
jgi:putative addiction module killer protein